MIYLKLRINQDQEWSLVTISSLAKMLVGVNNIVVENLDFSANDNEIVISARLYKRDQCRCGICGRKVSGYDCGNGVRSVRAFFSYNALSLYPMHWLFSPWFPSLREHKISM